MIAPRPSAVPLCGASCCGACAIACLRVSASHPPPGRRVPHFDQRLQQRLVGSARDRQLVARQAGSLSVRLGRLGIMIKRQRCDARPVAVVLIFSLWTNSSRASRWHTHRYLADAACDGVVRGCRGRLWFQGCTCALPEPCMKMKWSGRW